MRFNTHDTTPRRQSSRQVRIIFAVSLSFVGACLLFFAMVCSYYAKSILPTLVILLAPGVPGALFFVRRYELYRVSGWGWEVPVQDSRSA